MQTKDKGSLKGPSPQSVFVVQSSRCEDWLEDAQTDTSDTIQYWVRTLNSFFWSFTVHKGAACWIGNSRGSAWHNNPVPGQSQGTIIISALFNISCTLYNINQVVFLSSFNTVFLSHLTHKKKECGSIFFLTLLKVLCRETATIYINNKSDTSHLRWQWVTRH